MVRRPLGQQKTGAVEHDHAPPEQDSLQGAAARQSKVAETCRPQPLQEPRLFLQVHPGGLLGASCANDRHLWASLFRGAARMDLAILPAASALLGSMVGGAATLGASW